MEGKSDPTLLRTRSQRHDMVVPSDTEIFHMLLSTAPPTPLWISGPLHDKRIFLDGSYLLRSDRHKEDPKVDSLLFGNKSRTSLFIDYSGRMQASRLQQLETPRGQEMALVDEMLEVPLLVSKDNWSRSSLPTSTRKM